MHWLAHSGMLLLETLFLVGWVGSIVVVLISGVEDMHTVFQKDLGDGSHAISGDHDM